MIQTQAQYFDGLSARDQVVDVLFADNTLILSGDGGARIAAWSAPDIREVLDHAGAGAITLMPGQDAVERLVIVDQDAAAALRVACPDLAKRKVASGTWRRIGIWGAAAVVSVLLILFVIIPALANTLATLIPVEREIALGKSSLKQIEWFMGGTEDKPLTCSSPDGDAALAKMTERLTQGFDSPLPLDVRVFKHKMINAFAVPGGYVVLMEGLIKSADTPEEVAGVLAHEIGHVAHRDPTRLTLRSAGSVGILGLLFGDFSGGALILVLSDQLIQASYSKDAEAGADTFAHERLAEAKLSSAPMAEFFRKLAEKFGDEEGVMSHLASHPDLDGRQSAAITADTIVDENYDPILTPSEWASLLAICNLQARRRVNGDPRSSEHHLVGAGLGP